MIHDQDRSGWFGASDTARIMGNWNTDTFSKWWLVKLGVRKEQFKTEAMETGSALEHRILDALGITKRDRQIRIRRLRLRVNLDGETPDCIHEVKTYGRPFFLVTKPYWMQCQVETFAAGKPCVIDAYRLEPQDYENWFRPIEGSRLSRYPIPYDPDWVRTQYLPRLSYLANCLKKGVWPHAGDL